MKTVKDIIIFLNKAYNKGMKYLYYSETLKSIYRFYTEYIKTIGFIQVFIIFVLSFYIDTIFFKEKLYSIGIISLVVLVIRYSYISILKYFKWDGEFPIYNNVIIKKFFKEHYIINEICIIMFKYVHIYRILMLCRNYIAIALRYIRYYILKYTKLFNYWKKFEIIITTILNFIYEYIMMIVGEIYLNLKIRILNLDLKYLLVGRVQLFLIVCLTKGVIPFLALVLIMKLIKLINRRLLNWAGWVSKEEEYILKYFPPVDLNRKLFKNSYILQNLNFSENEKYLGYKKIISVFDIDSDGKDTLYLDYYNLRYYDIYNGIRMNEICEFNYLVRKLFQNRLFVEYSLQAEKLREHWGDLNKLNIILKESFGIVKKILKILRDCRIAFKFEITYTDCEPRLNIELVVEKYLKNFFLINKEVSLEEEIIQLQKLEYEYIKLFLCEDYEFRYCNAVAGNYFTDKIESGKYTECGLEVQDKYVNKIFIVELFDEEFIKRIKHI